MTENLVHLSQGAGNPLSVNLLTVSLEEENLSVVYVFLKDRMHFSYQLLNQGFY